MSNAPNFSVSTEDHKLIYLIAMRAYEINNYINFTILMMDLSACHNTCPLKLEELFNADLSDFAHDIGGIMKHINRRTGQLEDCFLPRFAIIKE